jgi:hypothetical protein
MLRRIETATAILMTLLAGALHILRVSHAGALWRDEAGAVQLAMLPTLEEVFQRFPHEAFPMLFPLSIRSFVAVAGDSDLAFRLFGMGVGIAILAALWINARTAVPRPTVPLASLALLGFHSAFLTYGDSLRGYGLGVLSILLCFWAFSRFVKRTDRRAVALAAAAAIVSVHFVLHNSAMVLGLALAAAAAGLIRRRWRTVIASLGVGMLTAVSLIPYVRPLAAARAWDKLNKVEELTSGQILGSLDAALDSPYLLGGWIVLLVLSAAGALALFQKTEIHSEESSSYWFRLLLIPAAVAAQYGLFLAIGYPPRPWYFLPLLAVLASGLDGMVPLRPAALRAARLAAASLVVMLLLPSAYGAAKLRMTNVDWIALRLEERTDARDLILVNPWFYGVSFHRYYQGRAPWMTIPSLEDHRMHRYDLLMARMATNAPLHDVFGAIRETLRSGHRVWLVGKYDLPPDGRPPPVLAPAPQGSRWGWRDAPYVRSWSLQISDYLHRHTQGEQEIAVERSGVSGLESLPLREFRGSETQEP